MACTVTVEELLAAKSSQASFHVAELAADLLRLCREGLESLRAALLEPTWIPVRERIKREVAVAVLDRGDLDGNDANRLDRIVARHRDPKIPPVLYARAVAEGLDAGAGQFFVDWFYGEELELGPNDAFPVARNDIRRWKEKPTGNPEIRTEPLDRLPRLRLAPKDFRGLRISMRWVDAKLAELEHLERFGVGVVSNPNIFEEYTWERYAVAGQELFFHVRPRDTAIFENRLRALISAAEARQVGLLLLPELCLTAELHSAFVSTKAFGNIPFVAAGSYHTPSGLGPGQNEASFFARGRIIGSHRKFRPVLFQDHLDANGTLRPVVRHEHLRVNQSRISVLTSGDCSIAIVICKDAMDNAVQHMLRELAVQLVLVPAMSPKVEDFADLARELGRDPQGYTLVANTGDTVAVVGTPFANNRVKLHSYSGVGLLMFDRSGNLIPR